jgi:hypothetical protein
MRYLQGGIEVHNEMEGSSRRPNTHAGRQQQTTQHCQHKLSTSGCDSPCGICRRDVGETSTHACAQAAAGGTASSAQHTQQAAQHRKHNPLHMLHSCICQKARRTMRCMKSCAIPYNPPPPRPLPTSWPPTAPPRHQRQSLTAAPPSLRDTNTIRDTHTKTASITHSWSPLRMSTSSQDSCL